MVLIGVTGSLGTGKTTVSKMFEKLGAKVLDADRVAHDLMQPGRICFRRIIRCFGQDILTRKRIDTKKLAARIFRNPRQRKDLEAIVHPQVKKVFMRTMRRFSRKTVVVWDVPLLFEAGWDKYVDLAITVRATRKAQKERIRRMGGLSWADANRRIRTQMPLKKKARLSDFTIDNSGSVKETARQVLHIWKIISAKA